MTITERTRKDMLDALEASIGKDPAMTLAEHLPPVGWADVATKQDLDVLRAHVDHRFEQVDHRFEQVDNRFDQLDNRFDQIGNELEQLRQEMRVLRSDLFGELHRLLLVYGLTGAGTVVAAVVGLRLLQGG